MGHGRINDVVGWLRGLSGDPAGGVTSDRRLLNGFVALRDESAFAALMQRHGPMVLGVCRRVLRDAHDAEDAFQATFLVLARRAGSISNPEALGGWLYGVAYRTALKARSAAKRRSAREVTGIVIDQAAANPDERVEDATIALDEELSRLPGRYRLPLVLCYLEGMTNDQAAAELGCPVGTLQSRLSRGRQRLRDRLTRRSLEVPESILVGSLPPAALSSTLISATARAATAFATDDAAIGGLLSANVAELARGGLKSMFLAKLKVTAAILLLVGGAIGAAVGVAASQRGSSGVTTGQAVVADLKREVDPNAEKHKQAELLDKKRLTEQIQIGREIADIRLKEYLKGRVIQEVVFESARCLRDVELEASKNKAERVAALEGYLKRMKDFEQTNKERWDNGRISHQDLLECTFYRLDAERRLGREKDK